MVLNHQSPPPPTHPQCTFNLFFLFFTGSFEVTVNGKLVFSKLSQKGFPVFKEVNDITEKYFKWFRYIYIFYFKGVVSLCYYFVDVWHSFLFKLSKAKQQF